MSLMQCNLKLGIKIPEAENSHGIDFKVKLLALFLLRALSKKIRFHLLSNVKGYGCWNDLIVHYSYKDEYGITLSRIALVHAKYADNASKKEVSINDLEGKMDRSFDLTNCFNSYKDCCNTLSQYSHVPVDYIMYTNKSFSASMVQYIICNSVIRKNKSFKLLNSNVSNKETMLEITSLQTSGKFPVLFVGNNGINFIENLRYYMQQSSESDLDKLFKDEYRREYPHDSDEVVDNVIGEVLKKVTDWRRERTSSFFTENDRIFETTRENKIINDIRLRSIQKLDRSPYQGLNFSANYLSTFVDNINGCVVNLFTSRNAALLTTLKVFQAFKKDDNPPIIIDMLEIVNYYEFRKISSAQTRQVLIVNCIDQTGNFNSMFQHLALVLKDNSNIKIIFIRNKGQTLLYFNAQDYIVETELQDCYSFSQFTEKTSKKILEKTIELQKRKVKLRSLITVASEIAMTPDIMQNLLEEKIRIGPQIEDLKNDVSFYLPRTFYRNDKLKTTVLTDDLLKDTLFIYAASKDDLTHACIKNYQNKTLIVSDNGKEAQDKFDEFCRENKKMNVHLVQIVAQKENIVINWKKSLNSMQNIVKYFEYKSTPINMLNEDDFLFATRYDQIIIISEYAGMGKTYVLKSLANKKEILNNDLLLQIDVKKLSNVLRKNRNTHFLNNGDNVLKFLLSQVMENKYDNNLTLLFVPNINIKIFLDGLDEISSNDYKKILEFLKCFTSISNIKIYISCRPNLQRELETTFTTISYKLQGFTRDNQLEFLKKYYESNLKVASNLAISKDSKIEKFLNTVIEIFTHKLDQSVREIAGIPLLTKMIADIYLGELEKYLSGGESLSLKQVNKIGLYKVYHDFIRSKCESYYNEKFKLQGGRADQNRQNEIKNAEDNNMILAVYVFCKEEQMNEEFFLNDDELKQLEVLLVNKSEMEFGIVSEIKYNGDVTFLHRSFAEFLFAIYILQNMRSRNKLESIKKLNIFTNSKWKLVQKFIDSYLSEDFNNNLLVLYKAIVNLRFHESEISPLIRALIDGNSNICKLIIKSINLYYPQGVSASTDKNRSRVFNTLIQTQVEDDLNALHHAILYNRKNKPDTVLLLLSQITAIQNVNDLVHKGMTILNLAVIYDCTAQEVNKIINCEDADINAKDEDGNTVLHLAAREGRYDITKLLLEFELDGNRADYCLGSQPPEDDSIRITRSKRGADINVKNIYGYTALDNAARDGHCDVTRLLLDHGADINVKNNYGYTALHGAASGGFCDVVTLLLDRGADISSQNNAGETALHKAARDGHCDVVTLLLDRGADISSKNKYGEPALHLAAIYRCCDVVKLLLDRGADISSQDNNGVTTLHNAAFGGHFDVVTLLLDRGADINIQNNDGDIALHVAARGGHCDLVTLLLDRGADTNIQNSGGNTALDVVERDNKSSIAKLLQEHAARIAAPSSSKENLPARIDT